jgi:hypothetical protein
MACIASRSQIIEIQPQVRPLGNGDLMVGVEMTLAVCERAA